MNHQPAYNTNQYESLQMVSRNNVSNTKTYFDSSPKPEIQTPQPSTSVPVSSKIETSVILAPLKSKRPTNKDESQNNNVVSSSNLTLATNLQNINNTATIPSNQRSTQHQLTVAQLLSQKQHHLEIKEEKIKETKYPKKNDYSLDTLDLQNSKKKIQTNINHKEDDSSNLEISTSLHTFTQELNKHEIIDKTLINSDSFQSASFAEKNKNKFFNKVENKIKQETRYDNDKLVYSNIQVLSSISQMSKNLPIKNNQVLNYENLCLNKIPQKTLNNTITPETPSLSTLYAKNITICNPQLTSHKQLVDSNENQIESLNAQNFNTSNQENNIFSLNQLVTNNDKKSNYEENKNSDNCFNISLNENAIDKKDAQFYEFKKINGQNMHENDSSVVKIVTNTEIINQQIQEPCKILNKKLNSYNICISEFHCFNSSTIRRKDLKKIKKYLSLPSIHSKDYLDTTSFIKSYNYRKFFSKSSESVEKITSLKENNLSNFEKTKEKFKHWQSMFKDDFFNMINLKSKLKNNSFLVNHREIDVKLECHGYHNAMVECQNCGYFCHEDCVHLHETNKYCSFCFKQKSNKEILYEDSNEVELIQRKVINKI